MKVTETHTTTITVEPGDKVRDLAQVLNDMPNGATISVYGGVTGWTGPYITVDHESLKG
ncbi:hypothetical protein SEA_SCARLETT_60 [Mycobacterium phage Scarlett]|uniref:Uncharacterized protein n=1 Tax=Mycobacterium phage KiSi TaxID=2507856 RepID=A0A410TBR8_9CAUD|nr:hypothetical protein I5G98_gp048 [Mycobacterium phage KiSi]AYR01660.1 hypothetical protein SEA_SCARLETT_60 [Mycobacterium phage Scarlett]QAU06478.1 hypothetical protein SEA_KISI_60 [Mycobacterium phage KiSi]